MHKNLYMAIILGANMLYINFCLFKETPMAPKGLTLLGLELRIFGGVITPICSYILSESVLCHSTVV